MLQVSHICVRRKEKKNSTKILRILSFPKILDYISRSIFVYAPPYKSSFSHTGTKNSELTKIT